MRNRVKPRPIQRWLSGLLLIFVVDGYAASSDASVDAASGLVIAPNWELAKAHCGGCHSYQLVTAQRGDKDYWLKTIRWMQRTQNLWQLPAQQEVQLLTYLEDNYNETEWGRRPALSPRLIPNTPELSQTSD